MSRECSTVHAPPMLRTEHLVLRRWRDDDREPFAALNADPKVMAYFASTLNQSQSDALVDWIEAEHDREGFGLWALEVAGTGEFIGFTGLSVPRFKAHFTPAVEIAWRLARASWGRGYATEAARETLSFAFSVLGLHEVVAFTSRLNLRSQAVMYRIGMAQETNGDFERPGLPAGHPLRPHVLWRIAAGGRS
jgi:RimJ/RimL family protein N-acetyltransferase